jgi:hypothetical protein
MKKEIENPKPDEKVCFNCKHMLWLVALGQGVKCALDKKDIPSRFHSCIKFDPKPKSN